LTLAHLLPRGQMRDRQESDAVAFPRMAKLLRDTGATNTRGRA
jgi:hypothetical protein